MQTKKWYTNTHTHTHILDYIFSVYLKLRADYLLDLQRNHKIIILQIKF